MLAFPSLALSGTCSVLLGSALHPQFRWLRFEYPIDRLMGHLKWNLAAK